MGDADTQPLTVVKLGGSFTFSQHLPNLVNTIVASRCPTVIVPGGGPFADTIRELQPRIGFSDDTAHRLALLAMCQYGELLASLHGNLRPVNGVSLLRKALGSGVVPIWMPWPLSDGLEALPASWEITSDSLAAWLAARLNANRLFLMKSVDPPLAPIDMEPLSHTDIVDSALPTFVQTGNFDVFWLGPTSIPHLSGMLSGNLPVPGHISWDIPVIPTGNH